MKKLDILFEDNSAIIINKPAGLASQGGEKVINSADKILIQMYKTPSDSSYPPVKPLLVHRLDKDTSGVLMAAKTKQAAARLQGVFNSQGRHKAVKQYLAVCCGIPEKKESLIAVDLKINNKIKKSLTKYKVVFNGIIDDTEYSVLEIELGTGRMHQIRRHLAVIGHPVLGDDKYGDFSLNKRLKIKRLLLHARRLKIEELNIDVCAPIPIYMEKYLSP